MAARREDVDLFDVLGDPKCARDYLKHFDWDGPSPECVVVSIDHKIPLKGDISDQEAIQAARIILHDVHIPRAMIEKKLEQWEH